MGYVLIIILIINTILPNCYIKKASADVEKAKANGFITVRSGTSGDSSLPKPFSSSHGTYDGLYLVLESDRSAHLAYCMSYNRPLGSSDVLDNIEDIKHTNDNNTFMSLKERQKRLIRCTLLYGLNDYDTTKSTEAITKLINDNKDRYLATQVLIWTIVHAHPNNTSERNAIRDHILNTNNEKEYFNNLYNKVSSAYTEVPSFTNTKKNKANEYELKWNADKSRYETTLTDNNDLLKKVMIVI